jgi:putative transposase
MAFVSRDNPFLYVTAVTHSRLPVFRTPALKNLAAIALAEAAASGGFKILAYVIMPDHLHILTDGGRKPSDTLRFLKGITSRRVVDYLKSNGYEVSLEKLRHEKGPRGHTYSLWQHHSNVALITSESRLMERVNYTHQNPDPQGVGSQSRGLSLVERTVLEK